MSLTPLRHGVIFRDVGFSQPPGAGPGKVTLGDLILSPSRFEAGSAAGTVIGVISGKTVGSVISVTPNDGRVAVAGDDAAGWSLVVGLTPSDAGEHPVVLRETHPNATNSPRTSPTSIAITPATGGGVPSPPSGFVFLIDFDGAYLTDQDGAYLLEAA